MMKNKVFAGIVLALTASVCTNVVAEDLKPHDHEQKFSVTVSDVNKLTLSSLSIFNDEQFVFNNELALLDWDSFFNSYAPHLKHKQDTILNWAGLSSINPKLLLAMMELQSNVITDPTSESLVNPFGDLSTETGFSEQVKDIANQLSQYFYTYAKLQQDIEKTASPQNKISTPTSAATVALTKVLTNNAKIHDSDKNSLHSFTEENKSNNVYDVLSVYEDIFTQSSQHLLKSNKSQAKKDVSGVNLRNNSQDYAATNNFSMRLPWPSGNVWRAGGAHSNTGSGYPYSSLDFYGSGGGWGQNTPWVQAANSGQVVRFSSCNMRIIHSSGYSTNYYHMSYLQHYSGAYVNSGAWLGKYANTKAQALCEGGQSTGPHLHFSLLNNGQFVSLQGHTLGAYTVAVGRSNYDTNCRYNYLYRNGRKSCANTNIYN